MLKAWILCFLASVAWQVSSAEMTLVNKLDSKARTTFLGMDKAHQEIALANLKKAHVSDADEVNVVLAPNGVIGLVDHFDVEDEDDGEEEDEGAAGTRQRRSSFDPTPEGFSNGVPLHHSNPSQTTKIIYLDFDGHSQSASGYTGSNPSGFPAFNARPWTIDGSSSFSSTEKARMTEIWQRVAEDYAPFDVDVTTEEPSTITKYVCRVLITEKQQVGNGGSMPSSGAAGYAWINVYGRNDYIDDFAPALVFPNSNVARVIAAVASHEAGHNFGLGHDGLTSAAPGGAKVYNFGTNGWSPIMGGGANRVTSWSKGEYQFADNNEDDLAQIASHLGYRDDEAGESTSTAANLPVNSNGQVALTAYITKGGDQDWYKFTHAGGAIDLEVDVLTISSSHPGSNMNTRARLLNANGNEVASNDPESKLDAKIDGNFPAGTYYLEVDGRGADDGAFTGYASIGSYTVTGSIEVGTDPPTATMCPVCPSGKERKDSSSKKFNIATTFAVDCNTDYAYTFCARKRNRVNSKVIIKLQRRKGSGDWSTIEKVTMAKGGDFQCFESILKQGGKVQDGQRYRLQVKNGNRARVRVLYKHDTVDSQAECAE
eukprot:m.85785 g.85785  ORF g.85785 m.85785 type:complete len:599 (-) comp14737_c0_seq2:111-1907(-)